MEFNEINNELLKSHYNYKDIYSEYNIDYNKLNNVNNNRYIQKDNEMRDEPLLFTLQKEISIADMRNVISLILMKYKLVKEKNKDIYNFILNSKDNTNLNKNIISVISYHLLSQINERILKNKLMGNNNHYASFFKIIKINLEPELNKTKYNSSNARFYLEIGREHKLYSFNIEVIVSYYLNTLNEELQFKYNFLNVSGINNNYTHVLNNEMINNNKWHYPINNSDDTITKVIEPNNSRVINIDKKISNSSKYQNNLANIKLLYTNTGCFITDTKNKRIKELQIDNPLECESYHEEYGSNGVWDKRCTKNTECPFYDMNRNKGGCNNGICEMPVGVTRIGYRHYLKNSMPECNNCDLYDPYCCYDNEKNNKQYTNNYRFT